nr:putative reverse transcriptase domain-containing protein [Tanacetum cinerariifolium]
MPPGSPPHQPPPPPPLAGRSRASRAPGASGSSQVPPPPPPLSTNPESPSKGSAAPSSSKTVASAEYQAWTTTDVRLKPSISLTPGDLEIDEDMVFDEQAQLSNDEDIGSAHIPKASALASNYSPPPEDSLLAQTGDIATFIDWFYKRREHPSDTQVFTVKMEILLEPNIKQALGSHVKTSYEVELADGKVVSTNTIFCGCTLALFNEVFKKDMLPTQLGSFDVMVGMDWLSYHCVVVVLYEKIVRIPLPNGKILEIQGERSEKDLRFLSCIMADEKKPEDICIVCDFSEVFTEDLSGLPLVRKIEFHINLVPGAFPVVKSPYRLVPSERLEFSNQLKELQDKGFIKPSHSQ